MSINVSWQKKVQSLIDTLDKTAVDRDLQGGHPYNELKLIRDLGILNLSIEKNLGGEGLSWGQLLQVIQDIAIVDSSVAHVFAFHFLQLISIKLYGTQEQYIYYAKLTSEKNLFWANALNPNDKRIIGRYYNSQLVVNGVKSYCSGSIGSDLLLFSAFDENLENMWIAITYSNNKGITIKNDWDAFGQRQTDSGTVLFNNVIIQNKDILISSSEKININQSIRTLLAQSILISLYIGIAKGSLKACKKYLNGKKAWVLSQATLMVDDQHIQSKFAQSYLLVSSSQALFNLSLLKIDDLLQKLHFITEDERGQLAISLIEAKITSHKAVMQSTSDIFEILGASSASKKLSLDRFWRNARVHTLHDPIDYKLQDLGRYLLTGQYPTPSAYS